jgi:hypothetical protein
MEEIYWSGRAIRKSEKLTTRAVMKKLKNRNGKYFEETEEKVTRRSKRRSKNVGSIILG